MGEVMSGSEARFPKSLIEFRSRFTTEGRAQSTFSSAVGRRASFAPAAVRPGLAAEDEGITYECAACGRQTSVTAGTITRASKLSLTTWF
jgi:hypothetical protein